MGVKGIDKKPSLHTRSRVSVLSLKNGTTRSAKNTLARVKGIVSPYYSPAFALA